MLRTPDLEESGGGSLARLRSTGPGFREVPARWRCWSVSLSSGDVWASGSQGFGERLEGAERA